MVLTVSLYELHGFNLAGTMDTLNHCAHGCMVNTDAHERFDHSPSADGVNGSSLCTAAMQTDLPTGPVIYHFAGNTKPWKCEEAVGVAPSALSPPLVSRAHHAKRNTTVFAAWQAVKSSIIDAHVAAAPLRSEPPLATAVVPFASPPSSPLPVVRRDAPLLCVDYVVVSNAPLHSCVLIASIRSLFAHAWPPPCRVLLISSTNCTSAELPAGTECIREDSLAPDLSLAAVRNALPRKLRVRAGWYLQQLLKLGVSVHVPSLTERFVIWDSDLIVLRRTALFDEQGRGVLRAGGLTNFWGSVLDTIQPFHITTGGGARPREEHLGSVALPHHAGTRPMSSMVRGCDYATPFTCGTGLPLLLPSARISPVARLDGRQPWLAKDPGSFVSHHAATRRSLVRSLLRQFAERGGGSWVRGILGCSHMECGFSEYAALASWVMHTQPDSLVRYQSSAPDWIRVGASERSARCPTKEALNALVNQINPGGSMMNLSFIGWEQAGHGDKYKGGVATE